MNSTGKWNLVAGLVLALVSGLLWADSSVEVPVGRDLHADGRSAGHSGRPILLVFSARYCDYCELLEEEILRPMILGGQYEDRVIIRKLVLDSGLPVEDFDGRRRQASELSSRYRVRVTPTVLLVDGQGNEIAERLVGINTVSMYGGYLDAAIEQAREAMAERKRAAAGTVNPM